MDEYLFSDVDLVLIAVVYDILFFTEFNIRLVSKIVG